MKGWREGFVRKTVVGALRTPQPRPAGVELQAVGSDEPRPRDRPPAARGRIRR